jgi:hypothetical protein
MHTPNQVQNNGLLVFQIVSEIEPIRVADLQRQLRKVAFQDLPHYSGFLFAEINSYHFSILSFSAFVRPCAVRNAAALAQAAKTHLHTFIRRPIHLIVLIA